MNKKIIYIIVITISVLLALFVLTSRFYSGEDGWIREKDGMWIEHGNPKTIPGEVREQYDAILCGFTLYSYKIANNISLESECLGRCNDYVIDVVNVPRTTDDDKEENQCPDYLNGTVTKLIEVDKKANIIRIVD